MRISPQWSPEAIERGVDKHVSARLVQLTSAPIISHDIYCEERYTSADGSRVAFHRSPPGEPEQLWVCDLPTLQVTQISSVTLGFPSSPLNGDNLYYIRPTAT